MPKSDLAILPADYSPVAERVALFYERFPAGRIVTRLISRTERETIFRAAVYRTPDELEPAATGWAAEREGDGDVNTTACLENTETSAIGRALANLGFAAVPSRARPGPAVARAVARAAGPPASSRARPGASPEHRPPTHDRHGDAGVEVTALSAAEHTANNASADLQARADAAGDLLALIRSAERSGLSGTRAELLRRRATAQDATAELHDRLARMLRRWIARRVARRVGGRAPRSGSIA